jgi:hypothetical protein
MVADARVADVSVVVIASVCVCVRVGGGGGEVACVRCWRERDLYIETSHTNYTESAKSTARPTARENLATVHTTQHNTTQHNTTQHNTTQHRRDAPAVEPADDLLPRLLSIVDKDRHVAVPGACEKHK